MSATNSFVLKMNLPPHNLQDTWARSSKNVGNDNASKTNLWSHLPRCSWVPLWRLTASSPDPLFSTYWDVMGDNFHSVRIRSMDGRGNHRKHESRWRKVDLIHTNGSNLKTDQKPTLWNHFISEIRKTYSMPLAFPILILPMCDSCRQPQLHRLVAAATKTLESCCRSKGKSWEGSFCLKWFHKPPCAHDFSNPFDLPKRQIPTPRENY